MCGSNNGCTYTLRISKTNHPNWKMYVGDFISYNERYKRMPFEEKDEYLENIKRLKEKYYRRACLYKRNGRIS